MTDVITSAAMLLNEKRIGALLPSQFSQQIKLEVFTKLPSTNDYLKQLVWTESPVPYHIVLAEQQTAGRGRKAARRWHSPFAENIYFSCRCRLYQQRQAFSLAVGLALLRVVNRYTHGEKVLFKYPNDLLWRGKKLSGILVELVTRGEDCEAVIGIGLNVNMQQAADRIDQPWTTLRELNSGELVDRNRLTAELISELLTVIEIFQQLGFDHFRDEWQRYLR